MSGIVELSETQLIQLEAHYELLLRWNQRINLTTVTKLDDAAVRHYCESLYLGAYVRRVGSGTGMVDIGSGAGFPGIPMAILMPEVAMDLVESHQRKAVFLKEASRSLANVKVLAMRAESLRGDYDWLVSRAVDPGAVVRLGLSKRIALLIGDRDARQLRGAEILPLPWGDHRVIAVVPRETAK
jgi:16S rRNA (guanine527-N7)-methyltransferase